MRRWLSFVLVSILLHGLGMVVLVYRSGDVADPAEVRFISVDLLRDPVPAVTESPSGRDGSATAPTPAPAAPRTSRRARTTIHDDTKVVLHQVRLVATQVESPGPVLTPGMFKLSWNVMSMSVDSPPEPAVEVEPGDVDGMLTAYFEDLKAQKTVKQGAYDPDLMAMRDAVEDQWHPAFEQIHGGPLAEAPGKLLQGWKTQAETYGKTGSPVEDPTGPCEPEGWKPPAGIIDVNEQMVKSDAFTKRVAVGLVLSFDGEGGWTIGEVKPSGHPEFDEAAIEALATALVHAGTTIPMKKIKTAWSLQADFIVMPPLPVAGFSFDLALGHFELAYPLKKKIKHRMKLLAVYAPSDPPHEDLPGIQ